MFPLLSDEQMIRQQSASYLVGQQPIQPGQLALTRQRLLLRPLDPTAIAEAKDRVWPGEVAGLEQALINSRQRRTEAENQLNRRRANSIGSTTGLQGH
jgi:hypothetical protein